MMTRLLPFLLLLGACDVVQSDSPTLQVSFDSTNQVAIQLERNDSHVFKNIHATANGIDCGSAVIVTGSTQIGDQIPASATFTVDPAQIGVSADIVVVEDGDQFEVVAPTFGTSRSAQIVTSLATPVVANEVIEATTGVAGDQLYGYFNLQQGQTSCVVAVSNTSTTPTLSLTMPSDLASAWLCGAETPGSLVQASLELSMAVSPEVTTCDGSSLTCNVTSLALSATAPVQLQF
jgi:hypothetical protein